MRDCAAISDDDIAKLKKMGEAFEHQFLTEHMKGGIGCSGDPVFPEADYPEELEGINQLTIDDARDEFRDD